MERYVKSFAWIGPVQEPGKENKVRGAADGKKFGQGLHQGEDDRLNQRHGVLDVLLRRLCCGGCRQILRIS